VEPEDRRGGSVDQEMLLLVGGTTEENNHDNSVAGGKKGVTRRGDHHLISMHSEQPINTTDLLNAEGKFSANHYSRRSFLS
jgi:hypothetical protein